MKGVRTLRDMIVVGIYETSRGFAYVKKGRVGYFGFDIKSARGTEGYLSPVPYPASSYSVLIQRRRGHTREASCEDMAISFRTLDHHEIFYAKPQCFSNSLRFYLPFPPTIPTRCSPTTLTHNAVLSIPKKNQYAALYPFNNEFGDAIPSPALPSALSVTDSAINIANVMPTAFPSWDTVLKTPPARAWVSAGKEDVINRFEIVNEASAPMVFRIMAGKAASQ